MHPRAMAQGTKMRAGMSMIPPRSASKVVRSPRRRASSCWSHPPPLIAAMGASRCWKGPRMRLPGPTISLRNYALGLAGVRGDIGKLARTAGEEAEEGFDIRVCPDIAVAVEVGAR